MLCLLVNRLPNKDCIIRLITLSTTAYWNSVLIQITFSSIKSLIQITLRIELAVIIIVLMLPRVSTSIDERPSCCHGKRIAKDYIWTSAFCTIFDAV